MGQNFLPDLGGHGAVLEDMLIILHGVRADRVAGIKSHPSPTALAIGEQLAFEEKPSKGANSVESWDLP